MVLDLSGLCSMSKQREGEMVLDLSGVFGCGVDYVIHEPGSRGHAMLFIQRVRFVLSQKIMVERFGFDLISVGPLAVNICKIEVRSLYVSFSLPFSPHIML